MSLKLSYRGATKVPVEVEGLTIDWARDRSLAEIERFEIFHGNCRVPLAEMFSVAGDLDDLTMEFEGELSGVHWIGAHMTCGQVMVHGSVGRHVGSQMRGGSIVVDGDAGGWVGAEMKKGRICIHGNAGHLVGAAYRGSTRGMTGGMILVDGNAGNEIGLTMRRGVIAVGGNAGDMVGFNMIAGTIVVLGECGIRPGAGMRRGTLALLGDNPPPLLPSFRYAATYSPQSLRILIRILREQGFSIDDSWSQKEIDLFHGDHVALGLGEILFPHQAA